MDFFQEVSTTSPIPAGNHWGGAQALASDGSIYVITADYNGGNSQRTTLEKINSSGARVWSKPLNPAVNIDTYLDANPGETLELFSALKLQVDQQGSLYAAGYIDEWYRDFGGYTVNHKPVSAIRRYDESGNILWTKTLDDSRFFEGNKAFDFAIAADGSIYVGGETAGDLHGLRNAGGTDAYISKLSSDGDVIWTRLVQSSGDDKGSRVILDDEGFIYLAGSAEGDIGNYHALGDSDGFLAKYSQEGDLQWKKTIGSGQYDTISAATFNPSTSTIYVAGETRFQDSINRRGYLLSSIEKNGDTVFVNKNYAGLYDNPDPGLLGNPVLRQDTVTEPLDMVALNDGNIIISGSKVNKWGYHDYLLTEYDPQGDAIRNYYSLDYIDRHHDYVVDLDVDSSGARLYSLANYYESEDGSQGRYNIVSVFAKNLGPAVFAIAGNQNVNFGEILDLEIIEDDPNGINSPLDIKWQVRSEGSFWSAVGFEQTYTPTSSDIGKEVRALVSYADADGYFESEYTDTKVVTVNSGSASFSIEGVAAPGGSLILQRSQDDPDGHSSQPESVQWEMSADGDSWDLVGVQQLFRPTSYDLGKYLRAKVSYTDSLGYSEEVLTDALVVNPPPNGGIAVTINEQEEPVVPDRTLAIGEISIRSGELVAIPITLDQLSGLLSADFSLAYDTTLFELPSSTDLITSTDLSAAGSFLSTSTAAGVITTSWYSFPELADGSGTFAYLNLKVKDGTPPQSTTIDLLSASLNENELSVALEDRDFNILPPTFQVFSIRELPNGLALSLPEAPDLSVLNLYDGQDSSSDAPDLSLTDASGNRVALSAHWQESSSELLLLSSTPLASGDYTLSIDSRSDGLISASSAELLDGNGDGTSGDAFSYSFSHTAADHSLSIADTARGAAQQLSLNGAAVRDGITGLPVTLTTTAALTSIEGSLDFDPTQLLNAALSGGIDLPDDWSLTFAAPVDGQLQFTASGTSSLTGSDLELFRFDALINPNATKDANPDLYGSTRLIDGSITATSAADTTEQLFFSVDPGLVVLAYSGDTTGNGSLSSLDASLIQGTVVALDSGFDAYDLINPTLIGDTTGNGDLSSLDAAYVQRRVVGLDANTLPLIPATDTLV